MTPQWNADIITPEEKGSGTQVLGDNQQVQTTLESGSNITIEDGKISASGTLENVQADWTETNPESPSYIIHRPNLATVATSGDYGDLSNRPDLSVYATTSAVADKADKVTGAVSGNLAGLDSNGNLTDSGVAAANLVHDAAYVHTDNNFSDSAAAKLAGIAAGAEVNVQSSWTETDTSSDAYIVGKPDLSVYAQSSSLATVATTGSYNDLSDKPTIPPAVTVDQTYNASSTNPQSGTAVAGAIANKQDTISDLATIRSGAEAGATAVQPSSLAAVATSGAYSDLSGTPAIPSGDQLVPSATSSDNGKVLTVDNNGDPAWVTPSAGTVYTAGDGVDITNGAISADVDGTTIGIDSTTKKIKLLSAIPTVDQNYSAVSANAQSGVAVAGAIANKQDTISDLATIRTGAGLGATAVQPGDLATVATTGAYSDLSGTPTIPSGDELVPSASSSDAGKVLTVDNNGDPSWVTPSAGTTYTAGDGIDITNNVISADVDGTTIGIDSTTKKIKLLSSIPTVDQAYNAASANAQSGVAVASAISTKQDTIADLATIRSGASAGATAVQPGDLATVATTGAYSDLSGTPTIPVVDQSYSASSANAQSGVAVAEAVAAISVDEVPAVTSSDDGKVLKATYSGGTGSYAWAAASAGSTYTASDPIEIDNDDIKLKYSSDFTKTLAWAPAHLAGFDTITTSPNMNGIGVIAKGAWNTNYQFVSDPFILTVDLTGTLSAMLFKSGIASQSNNWTLVMYKPGSPSTDYVYARETYPYAGYDGNNYAYAISSSLQSSTQYSYTFTFGVSDIHGDITGSPLCFAVVNDPGESVSGSSPWGGVAARWFGYPLINIYTSTGPVDSSIAPTSGETPFGSLGLNFDLADVAKTGSYDDLTDKPTIPTVDQSYSASSTNAQSGVAVAGAIATVNQVPASTSSDSTKVLTVDSSGTPVWAAAQGGTVDQTYNASSTNAQSGTAVAGALAAVPTKPIVAGSNITITENTNNITLSAAGTTYTAGNMVAINQGAIGVSTTAGITDIQQVSSLPANPVSTVLYLIPET